MPAVGTALWVLGSHPWLFSFTGPGVPSLAVFSRSLGPFPGCFSFFTSIWHVFHQPFCSILGWELLFQARVAECFSCIAANPRFRVSRHATLLFLVVRWLRHQPSLSPPSPLLDACFFSFALILRFGSHMSPALICFCSLDCEFLVVIVHLVLLSRCSVRDFSSGRFLQLHYVAVYSDVACRWSLQHCCVVLCYGVVAGRAPVR